MELNKGILFFFHCKSNTGYAIQSLEDVFYKAALAKYTPDNIHFAYPDISAGKPNVLPNDFKNLVTFNPNSHGKSQLRIVGEYIKTNHIKTAVGFDQGPYKKSYKYLRKNGVLFFISYWGAPMSSINSGLKLLIKKMIVSITPYQPDLYVFESQAMANTAVCGRGISGNKVRIIHLGVNTEKFRPDPAYHTKYAHDQFNIPYNRKIILYTGHMEPRKGVQVIMEAAANLIDKLGRKDIHFLLLGNQPGEEKPYTSFLSNKKAEQHVTFGGYRNDVPEIHRSCYLGVIASTGWDSFTMSSIEMSSSGLPLIVSSLQGLRETIIDGKTGFLFFPGDEIDLSEKILLLINDSEKRNIMSKNAREHTVSNFDIKRQIKSFAKLI